MNDAVQTIFKIIVDTEVIIGLLGNGFIATVNCLEWVKRRKLSLGDQMLTALAISRIGLLCLSQISILFSAPGSAHMKTIAFTRTTNIAWVIINHFNIWLSTILSTFYFLKIVNFSHPIFLYLKWRVKKVVLVTLLLSLFFLFSNIVILNIHINVWDDGSKRNMSSTTILRNTTQLDKLLLFTNAMFTLIPFTVSLTAFLLLVVSLWKHLRQVQYNATGSRDSSSTAHVKALQTGLVFLLLYSSFLLSFVIQFLGFVPLDENLIILWDKVTAFAFPSGHSCILILRSHKLRQAGVSIWRWLSCRFKGMELEGP